MKAEGGSETPSSLNPKPAEPVDVACAVILRSDGSFLLAQRPPGKPYPGYWEFPGGKVDPGEPVSSALARELGEELGIEVACAYPWITQVYTYPHATVRLHFFRVVEWRGEPHGREDQQLAWQSIGGIGVAPLLPANGPVLKALALPCVYAISNASELGESVFLERMQRALEKQQALIQIREPQMPPPALEAFATRVARIARRYSAGVLVNRDIGLACRLGARGVHLSSRQLAELQSRPECALCAASCHDADELGRALHLGVDFVVLGPVKPTLTHPGNPGIGWEKFSELIRGYPLPVYALGGLRFNDMQRAWQCGAHGISMQRAAW